MSLRSLPEHKRFGRYTPTLTGVTNIGTVTLLRAFYEVVGGQVLVFFAATVDPVTDQLWEFRMSLPFGAPIAAVGEIVGTCGVVNSAGYGGVVVGDPATDQALIQSANGVVTALDVTGVFSYEGP